MDQTEEVCFCEELEEPEEICEYCWSYLCPCCEAHYYDRVTKEQHEERQ